MSGLSPHVALSKISGPDGSSIVLGLRSARSGEVFFVSLIRGNSPDSILHRQRLQLKRWPDPKVYDRTSILRMGLNNGVRQLCIFLAENRVWNAMVLLSVFLSVSTLPFDDPFEGSGTYVIQGFSFRASLIDQLNKAVSLIFLVDVAIKIVAMGFIVGEKAYLRDSFNRLDFLLSILGMVDSYSSSGQQGMNAIRSMRALRPLKAINRFKSLKSFITLIFIAQQRLQNAVFIVVFVTFIFAIVSIQLFSGVLRQKCFHINDGTILGSNSQTCSTLVSSCPDQYICAGIGDNILGQRDMNCDDFFHATLVNVQVLTLTSWYAPMYAYMNAYHPASSVFFVLQIFFVPLYSVQIFQAILGIEVEPLQDYKQQARNLTWFMYCLSSFTYVLAERNAMGHSALAGAPENHNSTSFHDLEILDHCSSHHSQNGY